MQLGGNGWRYYNHALIPITAPHEEISLQELNSGQIWRKREGGTPLLARWTSNFDCGYSTEWWYVIKDTPFNLASIKSKRRYEINKGNKNFEVKIIDPARFVEEIFDIQIKAFSAYPEKYRPTVDHDIFIKDILKHWKNKIVYGAFDNESDEMCGYALLTENTSYVDFNVLKTKPESEKKAINAAIIYKILLDYNNRLKDGFYICDGSRSISHETSFQDYLEKYFEFRKAYGKLEIRYRNVVRFSVNILYPFRGLLTKLDDNKIIHNIISILKMESIRRCCE
ncbi:MAG: hypothetical protein Q4F05_01615 [bacterium]|nr:hypothetical protein [bacterium]